MRRTETTMPVPSEFLITKEYRRFEEFCNACRRDRYIGLCYGPPGVGKTLSARHYARWDLVEEHNPLDYHTPIPRELAECRTLLYTPAVTNTPRSVSTDLSDSRVTLKGLVGRAGYTAEHTEAGKYQDRCELILVDEADRLKMPSLETLRDLYDREGFGLILIGMPGLEKRLARYPQLYSRVGFAHAFRPLSQEEMHFILQHHWAELGRELEPTQFTDQEAVAAIIRITAGNFRLLNRLVAQIRRITQLNGLQTITREVVEAARECLVIGTT
jgi:DNA transposition AAA+ family ATPase